MSDIDIFDDFDDSEDVTLDPENKAPSNKVERFKGEKDTTYRGALLYFHPLAQSLYLAAKRKARKEGTEVDKALVKEALDKALAKKAEEFGVAVDELADWQKLDTRRIQFKKYKSIYKEGVGYVVSRKGMDGADADKLWDALGEEKLYYSTILLLYPTDREGNVEKELLLSRSKVVPWRANARIFNRLIEIDQQLRGLGDKNLSSMDLSIKCTNKQFQNFEINFTGNGAIWQKSSKIRDKFLPMAHALYPKLIDAREMSTGDVRTKLGLGGDSGEDVSDDDVEDFLDGV